MPSRKRHRQEDGTARTAARAGRTTAVAIGVVLAVFAAVVIYSEDQNGDDNVPVRPQHSGIVGVLESVALAPGGGHHG
jgi:hypothetical protein